MVRSISLNRNRRILESRHTRDLILDFAVVNHGFSGVVSLGGGALWAGTDLNGRGENGICVIFRVIVGFKMIFCVRSI